MSTVLRLGPRDHGRPMIFDEFMAGDYEEGYRYEIIDGRLYVTPMPNYPHDWVEQYVFRELLRYSETHPEVINRVTNKARVFVPGAEATTAPEPDIVAYCNFPAGPHVDWRDVSPLFVVEVLSGEDDEKDLVRNVGLYLLVPSIQEYWVFDIRADPAHPTLRVHRLIASRWEISELKPETGYATSLLPGFSLPVTPMQ